MGLTARSYPTTATAAAAAVPGATFSHGWLCDELSGDLAPVFGGVTLTASGAGIVYGDTGPRAGSDRAIGFSPSTTGKFSGSSSLFDIAANTDELVVAWVGKWNALPTAFGTICGKASGSFANGWSLTGRASTDPGMRFALGPSDAWGATISGSAPYMVGLWHVGIAVIDRSGTDVARFGVRQLFGSATAQLSSSPTGINGNAASTASNFTIGTGDWVPGNDNFRLAALYVGKGTGVAAGLAANLSSALASFADTISAGPQARAYTRMLSALLPPGKIWKLVGSTLNKVLLEASDELVRVDERVLDMLDESDPSTALELLPEYEAELDLEEASTTEERRARIVARLVARQRYRPVDFQTALAPLLGQDPEDVVVLERTAAFAASIGDAREIFRFFIYRDPGDPGTYFLESAQELVDQIKPTHTAGHVIESVDFLCDDLFSLCDRDILGI